MIRRVKKSYNTDQNLNLHENKSAASNVKPVIINEQISTARDKDKNNYTKIEGRKNTNSFTDQAITHLLKNQKFILNEEYIEIKNEGIIEGYSCLKCYKSFSQKPDCEMHHLEHISSFECSFCKNKKSLNAQTKEDYIQHLINHFKKLKQKPSNIKRNKIPKKSNKFVKIRNYFKENIDYSITKTNDYQQYLCKKCNKEFTTKGNLWTHLLFVHIDDQTLDQFKFPCDQCNKKFPYVSHLERHKKSMHVPKPITDRNKYENIKNSFRLGVDYSITKTKKFQQFVCLICNKEYKSRGNLWQHMLSIHIHNQTFECPRCQMKLKSPILLRLHLKRHENQDNNVTYTCKYCGKSRKSRQAAIWCEKRHIGDLRFECTECPLKFVSNNALQLHTWTKHVPESRETCKFCGFICKTTFHLKEHIRRKHGKQQTFECKICKRVYPQRNTLKQHEQTHTGFQCNQCGKVFKSKGWLKEHELIHANIRPWECTKCDKKFTTKKTLRVHLDTHENIRRHVCTYCNKAFTQRSSMKIHERLHTGEKPYKCDVCQAAFTSKTLLTSHGLNSHSITKFEKKGQQTQKLNSDEIVDNNAKKSTEQRKARKGYKVKIKTELNPFGKHEIKVQNQKRHKGKDTDKPNRSKRKHDRNTYRSERGKDKSGRDKNKLEEDEDKSKEDVRDDKYKEFEKRAINHLLETQKFIMNDLVVEIKNELNESSYSCVKCYKTFSDTNEIETHYLEHISSFECSFCNTILNDTSKEIVIQHLTEHYKEEKSHLVQCESCQKVHRSLKKARLCKKSHKVNFPFECPKCPQKFRFKAALSRHRKSEHNKTKWFLDQHKYKQFRESFTENIDYSIVKTKDLKQFSCLKCNKHYKTRQTLFFHLIYKHIEGKTFDCPKCEMKLRSPILLKVHLKRHQNLVFACKYCGETKKSKQAVGYCEMRHTGEFKFKCDECEQKLINKSELERHKAIVHAPKINEPCKLCGYIALTAYHLTNHIRRLHSGKKPSEYECNICHRVYSQRNTLNTHKKSHVGVMCNQCGKFFTSKESLRDHELIHANIRPWECPKCDKKFTTRKTLSVHLDTHDNIRRHVCTYCNKTFTQRSPMKIHERIHTGEKPYKCDVCPAAFTSKTLLTSHGVNMHGITKFEKKGQI